MYSQLIDLKKDNMYIIVLMDLLYTEVSKSNDNRTKEIGTS